ncbi:MAG: hypothetical protein O6952_06240, partial [Planctomycetota bacterium]|nr:hypothetical protein [Planctomycetota bacterium]
MGLFGRKTGKRELEEAKAAARKQPSPSTTSALIQKLIDLGDLDDALSAAKYGTDVYPYSESIRTQYRYLKRKKCSSEMKELQASVRSDPKPAQFQRLAEIYYDSGEEDKAITSAEEGIDKFPDFEGNHLIMGKIRYERWKEDFLPRDGVLASRHLERALELNKENYKTLLALSKFYLQVGAKTEAEDKLNAILYLTPDDQRAREYLSTVNALPDAGGELEEILSEYRDSRAEGENGQDIFSDSDIRPQKINKNANVLQEKLSHLGEIQGFVGAVILDREDELIASYFATGADEADCAR